MYLSQSKIVLQLYEMIIFSTVMKRYEMEKIEEVDTGDHQLGR